MLLVRIHIRVYFLPALEYLLLHCLLLLCGLLMRVLEDSVAENKVI